jgi:predicted MFS family arabinose efflux permease
MAVVAELLSSETFDDRLARRNALVLATSQALAGANNTVIVSTGAIVGSVLAPDPGLATLPISVMVLGMWAGTVPVGILSRSLGRRFALQTGTACGVLCGLIACAAVFRGSFGLFLLGALCAGLYAAAHQSYRFAATDTASEGFRPKAVAWVLAGGVFAGVLGPQLVIATKDAWPPYMFTATYLAQAAAALLAGLVLMFLRIPRPATTTPAGGGRSLAAIARMPRFIVAVACGVASYAMMNMVMTSAPLAMVECGHSVTQATLGLQWHVLAMYAPSFVTGSLIVRFGVNRVIPAGLGLIALSAAIGLSGTTVAHFWSELIVLGIGWNFAFVGATTMVTECHRLEERNKVQAFNDFLVFGAMAIGSFSSGQILASLGWSAVNEMVFPVILTAAALLLWLALQSRLSNRASGVIR